MTPPRFALLFAFGAVLGGLVGRGQTLGGPAGAVAAPDLADPLLAPFSPWNNSAIVYAGFGYKDNLLLGHSQEERSPFSRGGFDLLLWHLPEHRPDYSFFLTDEGTHYFEGQSINHEVEAAAQAEVGYALGGSLKATLDLRGNYFDQVLDISDSDFARVVADIKGTRAGAIPKLRWTLGAGIWLEGEATVRREDYVGGAFNARVGAGTVRLGYQPSERCKLTAAGTELWRHYENRDQFTAAGRELLGTQLKIAEREGEVRADLGWDRRGRWKTITRLGWLAHRDNGSGYFSYHQRQVAQEITWEEGSWKVHFEGTAKRQEFDVQTVGFGLAPPARIRDEFSAQGRIERKLSERWALFAEYTWERSRCNDPIASYVMNEGLLGARWTWEK